MAPTTRPTKNSASGDAATIPTSKPAKTADKAKGKSTKTKEKSTKTREKSTESSTDKVKKPRAAKEKPSKFLQIQRQGFRMDRKHRLNTYYSAEHVEAFRDLRQEETWKMKMTNLEYVRNFPEECRRKYEADTERMRKIRENHGRMPDDVKEEIANIWRKKIPRAQKPTPDMLHPHYEVAPAPVILNPTKGLGTKPMFLVNPVIREASRAGMDQEDEGEADEE